MSPIRQIMLTTHSSSGGSSSNNGNNDNRDKDTDNTSNNHNVDYDSDNDEDNDNDHEDDNDHAQTRTQARNRKGEGPRTFPSVITVSWSIMAKKWDMPECLIQITLIGTEKIESKEKNIRFFSSRYRFRFSEKSCL